MGAPCCMSGFNLLDNNLYVFIFRDRSGRRREKQISEGVSYLVAIMLETKGSRGVLIIIRIIEAALLVLALIFHYLVGMKHKCAKCNH